MIAVTRTELRRWVEEALTAVPLSESQASKLRAVAETAETTRFGGAGRNRCPAQLAGIDLEGGVLPWMCAFDGVVGRDLRASRRRKTWRASCDLDVIG